MRVRWVLVSAALVVVGGAVFHLGHQERGPVGPTEGHQRTAVFNPPPGSPAKLNPGGAPPTVEKGAVLAGRVFAASNGSPVPGARVEVETVEKGTVESGPDGAFHLTGLPEGRRWLTVRSPVHIPVRLEVDLSANGETARNVFVSDGAVVEGRVHRGDEPVAGAAIEDESGVRRCLSRSDGLYELPGFPAGHGTLRVTGEGIPEHLFPFDVEPGQARLSVDLPIEEPWGVPGVVLGPDGLPVQGAVVALRPGTLFGIPAPASYFGGGPGQTVVSGADGSFLLKDISRPSADWGHWSMDPPGPRLWARKEGLGIGASEKVHPERGKTSGPVTIRIPPAVEVRGTVRDEQGVSVPLAALNLVQSDLDPVGYYGDLGSPPFRLATDAEGTFTARLQPGRWWVRARAEGFFAFEAWLSVPPEEGPVPWDLRLAPGGDLSGRAVDKEGKPIEGAEVAFTSKHAADASTRTDSEGRFLLRAVPAVFQERGFKTQVNCLLLRRAGFRDLVRTNVPPGPAGEDFRMERIPAGTLGGVVLLEDGTTPARVCQVQVYREAAGVDASLGIGGPAVASTAVNDDGGRFRIPGLDVGTYVVEARLGSRMARVAGVRVPPEGDVTGVRVVLRAGGSIVGRVQDSRGSPVKGAYVQLCPRAEVGDPGARRNAWADADGRFEFLALPPGLYGFVIPNDPPLLLTTASTVVRENAETPVTIVMFRAGTLALKALDGEGKPVRGARATFLDDRGEPQDMSDATARGSSLWAAPGVLQMAEGLANFPDFRPGDYRARFSAEGLAPAESSFTVREGETTAVELVLRKR